MDWRKLNMYLSEYVSKLMEEKNLSVRKAAVLYHFSPTSIQNMKHGMFNTPTDTLLKHFCDVEGVSVDELRKSLEYVPIKTPSAALNINILKSLEEEDMGTDMEKVIRSFVGSEQTDRLVCTETVSGGISEGKKNEIIAVNHSEAFGRLVHMNYGNVFISTADLIRLRIQDAAQIPGIRNFYLVFANRNEYTYAADLFRGKIPGTKFKVIFVFCENENVLSEKIT